MSRTRKDRPYRIKVNEDGCYREAHHHHERFGEKITRTVYLRDNKGKIIFEEQDKVEIVRFARVPRLIYKEYKVETFGPTSSLLYINGWMNVRVPEINPLWLERERLLAEGKGWEEMVTGKKQVPKTIKVVEKVVKDYCTVNEPWDGDWWGENPCYKGLPDGYAMPRYHSKWDKAQHRGIIKSRRNKSRTAGRKLARGYNAEADLEDFETEMNKITEVGKVSGWW